MSILFDRTEYHVYDRRMKRTQIFLTDRQVEIIKDRAAALGISMAEMIRRILDRFLERK